MGPGWADTIWSIEVMTLGLVYKCFLIDLHECLTLVLHGLLWEFPNIEGKQGFFFLVLLSFLGITRLLDTLLRYLKEQCISLWCQNRIYLSSCRRRSSVGHILAISSLMRLATIVSFSTSSRLVRIWYGILVGVRKSSRAFSILSLSKFCISQVSPQGASLVHSSRVANLGGYDPFWYINLSFWDRWTVESSLMGAEGSDRASELGSEVGSLVGSSLGGLSSEVSSTEGGLLRDYSSSYFSW